MKSPLQWLLSSQLKRSHSNQQFSGFTLIELLVGLILAVLVITPLLGFMINIMDTDRKELVKTTSEQEIKAALDYIARDLQEAVYIYDADGIKAIRDQLPHKDKKSKFFPVLVFWKRQFIRDAVKATSTSDCAKKPDTCNDALVYSLVAYYLIKDDSDATPTWSKTARIGRFQISNGYGNTDKEIKDTTDDGFQLFSLEGTGSLKEKMNKWTKNSKDYQQGVLTLVDYIDQTPISNESNPAPSCSPSSSMQLIPQFSGSGDSVASGDIRTRSFYACVNSDSTVAEVYLRGNAIARIENPPPTYRENISIYFPQASVRVQGRGFLFSK
jgi:type II secretory pathway pseudopilin PulG